MAVSIQMPLLSLSMEKGNIVRWLKKEGDPVRLGEVIAEVETDKATMEIEALDEGILARIVRPAGSQDVPVNDVIAILDIGADSDHPASMSRTPAPADAIDTATKAERVLASPLARRIAREAEIDLTGMVGSGPLGRIVRRDVERGATVVSSDVSMRRGGGEPEAPVALERPPAHVLGLYEPGSYEEVPIDGMRRAIANKVIEATQTIPHFYLTIDCRADAMMKLRAELNIQQAERGANGVRFTLNDFLVRAMALALQMVPEANVVWTNDRILRFRNSDIAVVVANGGGLYMPVIRRAETKSLSAISKEIKSFVERAGKGGLSPEESKGGSASISNLGMYGVSSFQPIINPPHAFILGVGAVRESSIPGSGQSAPAHAFTVTMSCDHRVIDGALAARLLAAFRAIVEEPMRILV